MDDDARYIPHSSPMFSQGSLARSDLATNLAIPILAEGGWAALTLRSVATAANVTPQAISAWFPTVGAMRLAVASRYGDRWIRARGSDALTRVLCAPPRQDRLVPGLALALMPHTWLEELFDGIWLTVVEAGRWDEATAAAVSEVQERETDIVRSLVRQVRGTTGPPQDHDQEQLDVELVLALVRGMRLTHAAARAGQTHERAARLLERLRDVA